MSRSGRPSLFRRILASQIAVLILVVSMPWLVVAAVPGALRPTGIVLCPDDKPDAHVVQYTTETSDGTGTNWTLFCMDDRGAVEEVGSWAPLGVYLLGWLVLLELIVLPLAVVSWLQARRSARRRPPGAPRGGGSRRRRWAPDPGFQPPPIVPPPVVPPPVVPPPVVPPPA